MKSFRKRIFPILLLDKRTFFKSVKFKDRRYVGNPINTVQIFNQIGVDEIAILDVNAYKDGINYEYLSQIAIEAFVPLAYGGGISSVDEAKKIINLGFEKVILCSSFLDGDHISKEISETLGASSCALCINLKRGFISSKYYLYDHRLKRKLQKFDVNILLELEELGFGEVIVQSVDSDGTWDGYSREIIDLLDAIDSPIPIDYVGGINSTREIKELLDTKHISAVGVSSLVLFQRKNQGVVVSFPLDEEVM